MEKREMLPSNKTWVQAHFYRSDGMSLFEVSITSPINAAETLISDQTVSRQLYDLCPTDKTLSFYCENTKRKCFLTTEMWRFVQRLPHIPLGNVIQKTQLLICGHQGGGGAQRQELLPTGHSVFNPGDTFETHRPLCGLWWVLHCLCGCLTQTSMIVSPSVDT